MTTSAIRLPAVLTAAVVAAALVVAGPSVGPASAQDAAAARAAARQAATQVLQATRRAHQVELALDEAIRRVGQDVSTSVAADTAHQSAARAAQAASDLSAASARALYLSGGQAGLLSTLLESTDLRDLTLRAATVRRVLAASSDTAVLAHAQEQQASDLARRFAVRADASVVRASDVADLSAQLDGLLAGAQHRLDRLSARAKELTDAEAAAAALAAARLAAARARSAALVQVRAQLPPEGYFELYRAAARTCVGMDWTLLAAVGQVESGHGRDTRVSSAGAVGPMQFMPATFTAYAVDGDRDGRTDPYSPADAVYTAARYLCTGGAGTPSGVPAALFRYNRAQWYVELVLRVQQQLQVSLA